MLAEIDAALEEHEQTQQERAEAYFTEAMDSVRDLIDYSLERGHSAMYVPSQPAPVDPPTDIERRLGVTHALGTCAGQVCILHNRTDHHMSTWPMLWRLDTQSFERMCVCGVGHPDPDQFEQWKLLGRTNRRHHSCDGCCIP